MRAIGPSKFAAIFLTVVIGGIVALGMFRIEIIDDAFISFRVARNFARGCGYTYNTGEWVEASTSLTWPLLLSVFYQFTNGVAAIASSLGATFAAVALIVAFVAARKLDCGDAASCGGVVVVALMPQYWLTAASGLEGGLYALLLALTFAASGKRLWLSAVFGGLLFATRPEGAAVFAFLVVLDAWKCMRERKLATLTAPLAIWLSFVGGITAWRLFTFGSPLPNSVIAKSVPITAETIAMGLGYLAQFSAVFPHWIALAALSPLFMKRDTRCIAMLAIVVLQIPVILRNGGDWIAHFRLLMQYGPAIAVLSAITLKGVYEMAGRRFVAAPILALLAACAAAGFANQIDALASWRRPNFDLSIELPAGGYSMLARTLRPVVAADDVIAPEAIGRFGDELNRATIHDFFGLADPVIAWGGNVPAPPFGKTDFKYTLDCSPVMLIFHSGEYHPNAIRRQDNRLDPTYVGYELPPLNLTVYVRRDALPRFAAVLAAHQGEPIPQR